MEKRIRIEITAEGKILAETLGMKGKDCLPYIAILEELLDANTIDSNYTDEFHEVELKSSQRTKQKVEEGKTQWHK